MTSEQSRQSLADFGYFMRSRIGTPGLRTYGLLDFGKFLANGFLMTSPWMGNENRRVYIGD